MCDLFGDGAYPLLPWLLKPCPINAILNRSQRRFNKTLSSARSTVERAFAILKGRLRILLKRLDSRFHNVSEIILTCRILHNFCQEAGEEFNDDEVAQRSAEHCSKYSPVHRAAFVVKLKLIYFYLNMFPILLRNLTSYT